MKIWLATKLKNRKYSSADFVRSELGKELFYEDSGRPYVQSEDGVRAFISISHTRSRLALLEAGGLCGMDIEELRRKPGVTIVRRLHPLEQEYLGELEAGGKEWRQEFLRIWVCKEAYMKMCGEGIRMGLSKFSVLDEQLHYKEIVSCENYPDAFLILPQLSPDLICAVALVFPEELEGIIISDYKGEAKKSVAEAAADMLAARDYMKDELAQKLLKKGYSEEEAFSCIRQLAELGYVDDEALVSGLARQAAAKGRGRRRIAFDLRRRGAKERLVKKALEEISEDESLLSEGERAMRQANKIIENSDIDEKLLNRVGRRLAGLGYEASVIYDVIAEIRRKK